MLLPRVITALVLLAVLLPAIFIAPAWVWGLVSLAFLAMAAHEWACLLPNAPAKQPPGAAAAAPLPRFHGWTLAAILVLAGLIILGWRQQHAWPPGVLIFAMGALAAFWIVAGSLRLRAHESRGGGQWLVGLVLLGCWLALYELRLLGTYPLISSMAVVWVADIAAYFVGRAIGRRKLAPAISPGKSWEGAIGGALAVMLVGFLVAWLGQALWSAAGATLPARLVSAQGHWVAGIVLIGLAALSIVGDLHESLLKRQAGVKDSGWILPGHGGVLDRIDALIPTMPVALLIYEILQRAGR